MLAGLHQAQANLKTGCFLLSSYINKKFAGFAVNSPISWGLRVSSERFYTDTLPWILNGLLSFQLHSVVAAQFWWLPEWKLAVLWWASPMHVIPAVKHNAIIHLWSYWELSNYSVLKLKLERIINCLLHRTVCEHTLLSEKRGMVFSQQVSAYVLSQSGSCMCNQFLITLFQVEELSILKKKNKTTNHHHKKPKKNPQPTKPIKPNKLTTQSELRIVDLEVLHNIIVYPCFIRWAQGDNCLCLARERWSVDWFWRVSALCSAQFVVRSTWETRRLLQDHVLFHLTPFICRCDLCYLTVTCWPVLTVAGKPE